MLLCRLCMLSHFAKYWSSVPPGKFLPRADHRFLPSCFTFMISSVAWLQTRPRHYLWGVRCHIVEAWLPLGQYEVPHCSCRSLPRVEGSRGQILAPWWWTAPAGAVQVYSLLQQHDLSPSQEHNVRLIFYTQKFHDLFPGAILGTRCSLTFSCTSWESSTATMSISQRRSMSISASCSVTSQENQINYYNPINYLNQIILFSFNKHVI